MTERNKKVQEEKPAKEGKKTALDTWTGSKKQIQRDVYAYQEAGSGTWLMVTETVLTQLMFL